MKKLRYAFLSSLLAVSLLIGAYFSGRQFLNIPQNPRDLPAYILDKLPFVEGYPLNPMATSTTTHTVKKGESLKVISAKYGIPTPIIMEDNSLKSTSLTPGQSLTINPLLEPRKVPEELARLLYSSLDSPFRYEDAFVGDVTDEKGLETVVLLSQPYFRSGRADTLFMRGYDGYVDFTREASTLKFVILDSTNKKIFQEEHSWTDFGINNQMYPLGTGNQFLLHTTLTKEWFAPWMYRDVQKVYGFKISGDSKNQVDIGSFIPPHSFPFKGRSVRIQENNGGMILIGNYFHYDIGNFTPDNYDGEAKIKRMIVYSDDNSSDTTTPEFVAGELARMLFENELSQDDIRFLARQNREDLSRALDIIRKTERDKEKIAGAVASALSSGRDPLKEAGNLLGVNDSYTISMLLDKQVSPYIFVADQTGKLTLWEYKNESSIAYVLPRQTRAAVIFDNELRELALQGGVYLGKESPLGVELTLSRNIDATAQPVGTNLVIIDRKDVMKRTIDTYEKVRKGELSVSEAFAVAGSIRKDLGIGLDVSGSVNNIANVISKTSGAVDVLREHDIQNIGEINKIFSSQVDNVQLFNDLMKAFAGEKDEEK